MYTDPTLPRMYRKRSLEFKLIRDAMYTDPHDQSVWIYHRWLIGESKSVFLMQLHCSDWVN